MSIVAPEDIRHMSFQHRSYHHIVNSEVGSFIRKHQSQVSTARVEEKIDGSNFYFVTDGESVKVGRRNDLLKDEEVFFQFQLLQHASNIGIEFAKKECLALYSKLVPDKKFHLYIYGELIPTQKRIPYFAVGQSTQIRFIVFDVFVGDSIFPRAIWEEHLATHGFLVNPVLFRGTLEECIAFDVETTKSVIPRLLGLDHEAMIEGVVIKSGSFVVKKKAEAFREIEHGRKRRAQSTKNPHVDKVSELIESMLVESRLENIISQIGTTMVPDAPRLTNTFILDAINEAKDDDDSDVHLVSNSQLNKIKKILTGLYIDFVKEKMGW